MADISEPAPIRAVLPTDKHGQQRKRKKDKESQETDPGASYQIADVTDVMGIPVAEVTPKVQQTINNIMAELDKTRTELEHAKSHIQYLEELADRHPVLPLINRRGLHRELSRTLALAERAGVSNSFVCFHVSNMDDIRRRLGREGAEAALVAVAETISANVRDSDVVGYLGGGDFGVILTVSDDESATEKADSLVVKLTDGVKVNWGLHTFNPGDDADQVLRQADQDLRSRTTGLQMSPDDLHNIPETI